MSIFMHTVNEQEARRYQAMLLQNQQRQQAMQLQQQQLQRQRMQLANTAKQNANQLAQRLKVSAAQQQPGPSGLRISSISSLKSASSSSPNRQGGNVNLPSSISISRVEPDNIRQRLPAGTSMVTSPTNRGGTRTMPKLRRGGISGISRSAWHQQVLANSLGQSQQSELSQLQMHNGNNGRGGRGIKRPIQSGQFSAGGMPPMMKKRLLNSVAGLQQLC